MHKSTEIALAEVGYLEKSKSAYKANPNVLYEKTAGAGADNYTKYGYELHKIYPKTMDFPAYWCDMFYDWVMYKGYGVSNIDGLIGGFDDYTKNSIALYKKMGAFFLKGAKQPREGDQVFFSTNGALSGVNHTGYVYDVSNGVVRTVEGNASNDSETNNGGGVVKREYPINSPRIYGYGRPLYEKYEKTDGWVQTDAGWYYYRNGVKVKREWIPSADGKMLYRVGIDGKLLTGWHDIYREDGTLGHFYFEEKREDILGALWGATEYGDNSLDVYRRV